VGKGLPIDGGVGCVQDVRGVTVVERASDKRVLSRLQLELNTLEDVLSQGSAEGGEAVDLEERAEGIEVGRTKGAIGGGTQRRPAEGKLAHREQPDVMMPFAMQ